jgi:hypothetical protein
MDWVCGTHGERRNLHNILVGKHEGKGPLGRRRHRSEDNIKMDFKILNKWDGRMWSGLMWRRVGASGGLL